MENVDIASVVAGADAPAGGSMAGAFLVIVLCGLLLPIGMVLAAVVFDAVVVAWATYRIMHDDWAPRITRSFTHLHVPHLRHGTR